MDENQECRQTSFCIYAFAKSRPPGNRNDNSPCCRILPTGNLQSLRQIHYPGNLKRRVHIMETSTASAAGDILPYIKKRRKKTARKTKAVIFRKVFQKNRTEIRNVAGRSSTFLPFPEAVQSGIRSAVCPAAVSTPPEI